MDERRGDRGLSGAVVGALVVGQVVLSRTVFGRYLVAIGTNEQAVRLSGIDPRPVWLAVFALAYDSAGLIVGGGSSFLPPPTLLWKK